MNENIDLPLPVTVQEEHNLVVLLAVGDDLSLKLIDVWGKRLPTRTPLIVVFESVALLGSSYFCFIIWH